MKKSAPLNITLPGDLPEKANQAFVRSIDNEAFFGRPSLSMVIRALLEIGVEKADAYEKNAVTDYETLKDELARMLSAPKRRAARTATPPL